jgi:hypothetical protein
MEKGVIGSDMCTIDCTYGFIRQSIGKYDKGERRLGFR